MNKKCLYRGRRGKYNLCKAMDLECPFNDEEVEDCPTFKQPIADLIPSQCSTSTSREVTDSEK